MTKEEAINLISIETGLIPKSDKQKEWFDEAILVAFHENVDPNPQERIKRLDLERFRNTACDFVRKKWQLAEKKSKLTLTV